MIKLKSILAIMCTAFLLASCTNEITRLTGEYSYKVSGTALVDTAKEALPNEIGSLQIIDRGEDGLLLTFNTLEGALYTADGSLKDGELLLAAFQRTLRLTASSYKVTVNGSGTVYDGTIVFNLTYAGTLLEGNKSLTATDVLLIAKKNK